MAKISAFTEDLYNQKFRILCDLFPEAVTESKDDNGQLIRSINADILSREISAPVINNTKQSYSFTWPDKDKIMNQAAQPTTKTLRPIREKSSGKDSTPGNFDSENIYIEGDNLDALKNLRETYLRQIKLIYIDPPYNTGHDFIYQDNFSQSQHEHEQKSEQRDSEGNRLVVNKETDGKFHDYIIVYAKSEESNFYLDLYTDEGFKFSDEYESERGKYKLNQTLDYNSLQYSSSMDYPIDIDGKIFYPGQSYDKYIERKDGKHGRVDWVWRWSRELFDYGYKNGFVVVRNSRIYTKTYQNAKIVKNVSGFTIEYTQRTKFISTLEFTNNEFSNDNSKKDILEIFDSSIFEYSKPFALIKQIIKYATNNNDIILDFFSGSATTAHAVMSLNAQDGGNRKFILVQIPEETPANSEAFKVDNSQ